MMTRFLMLAIVKTYTATFIPTEHPEYYQTLTAQVKLEISKAIAPKIQDLDLKYSWAAKGEKAVQIPGLPEDLGETNDGSYHVG